MVGIDPSARDAGADIRLVLMITGDDFDRGAEHLAAKVLDRHLRSEEAALPGSIGVEARHVVKHAEFNNPVRNLGQGRSATEHGRGDRQAN